jgi:protocatechuate 3,4-dioxygenase beta subunit
MDPTAGDYRMPSHRTGIVVTLLVGICLVALYAALHRFTATPAALPLASDSVGASAVPQGPKTAKPEKPARRNAPSIVPASDPGKGLHALAGHVRDTHGQPLKDVALTLTGPSKLRATTDADGGYRIDAIRPGKYTFEATSPGYDTYTKTLEITGSFGEDIELTTTYGVVVEVFAANTGEPLSSIEFDLEPHSLIPDNQPQKTFSETGRFEILHLETVPNAILVSSPGFKPQRYACAKADPATRRCTIEARLQPDGGIPGTVTDEAGKPVSGALLSFGFPAHPGEVDQNASTVSNTDGHFWIAPPEEAPWVLVATRSGYAPGYVTRDTLDLPQPPINIVMSAPGAIRGVVVDKNGPCAKAEVSLRYLESPRMEGNVVETDEQGRFAYDDVAPGTARVQAFVRRPQGDLHGAVDVALKAGTTSETRIVLEAPPGTGASLSGRITRNGQPVFESEVQLWVVGDEGSWKLKAKTDEFGTFAFNDVVSGTATLVATSDSDHTSQLMRTVSLNIPKGGRITQDVELIEGIAKIRGTVAGVDSAQAAMVLICEGHVTKSVEELLRQEVDPSVREVLLIKEFLPPPEGSPVKDDFVSQPLPPGHYTVILAVIPEGSRQPADVKADFKYVDLKDKDIDVSLTAPQ